MASALSAKVLIMMLLGTGGGGDLLSLMSTESYWKAKNVKVSTETMLAELKAPPSATTGPAGKDDKVAEVRRLMVIRTLGELKSKEAVAALEEIANRKLKPALGGSYLFDALYARQALAAINGKAIPRPPATAEALASDLWLLPQECGVVGQASVKAAQLPDVEKMLAALVADDDKEFKAEVCDGFNQQVLMMAELIGNARLDAMTFGVSKDLGSRTGFVALVARGAYDRAALGEAIKASGRSSESSEEIDGVPVFRVSEAVCILASNDRFVFLIGPGRENIPAADFVKAVKAGKGTLAENADLTKLIKSLDTTKPSWAAMKVSESYTKAPYFDGLDTITVTADANGNRLSGTLTAIGADANRVKECHDAFVADMDKVKDELARSLECRPRYKLMYGPILDTLSTIQLKLDGAKITATADVPDMGGFILIPSAGIGGRRAATRPSSPTPAPVAVPKGTDF